MLLLYYYYDHGSSYLPYHTISQFYFILSIIYIYPIICCSLRLLSSLFSSPLFPSLFISFVFIFHVLVQTKKDRPETVILEMSRQTVYVDRVGEASLVNICRKSVQPEVYKPVIEKAVIMLDKGNVLFAL